MHIGIILDGNRRFAKSKNQEPSAGHEEGAKRIGDLLNWGKELGINELTLYCFSLENFNRSKKEVDFLMSLFKRYLNEFKDDKRLQENKIKIRIIGEIKRLDNEFQRVIKDLEDKTSKNKDYIINFAIAYGGRQEILSAVKKLIKEGKEITEENFKKCLWISDCPDLIIRTGGELRTSNFLPWQSVYSEWVFLEKMWPEFTKRDLEEAIKEFKKRQRRFGK